MLLARRRAVTEEGIRPVDICVTMGVTTIHAPSNPNQINATDTE